MKPITIAESKRFAELEAIIKAGKRTFLEVGKALAEIRESRYYENDFDTFEEYCSKQWGFARAQAYRLIEAADIALSPMGDTIKNERQARELAKVPKEKRAKVLRVAQVHAEANCKPVTAKAIAEAAESVMKPQPDPDEPPGLVEWPVEPIVADPEPEYFLTFQASLKDLVRNIPKAELGDVRYRNALQAEATFLRDRVNSQKGARAYV